MTTCMAASAVKFCQKTCDFFSKCITPRKAASAVKFCQKMRDFFSKFYRSKFDFLFLRVRFLDSTYIRAVDYGHYFSPKITL